jgi:uncharacterized delta-60 repeat protein
MCALAVPAQAEAGVLDPSFGVAGTTTTNLSSGKDAAFAVAVQDDGTIVAAGQSSGAGGKFALIRYLDDGTLDTSFGGDGKVTTNLSSAGDWANAVAIQEDGKIVAAGRASGGGGRFALVRYNPNGTLDSTFGGDGKITTNFTPGDDEAFGVAVRAADDTIVAAGFVDTGSGGKFGLVRYNADGTRDTSFGGDGKVTTDLTNKSDGAYGVAIQPADGKILAAGTAGFDKFALARYNTDGTLDATFSGNGKAITNFTNGVDFARGVVVQGDGMIVAAGIADAEKFAVARYEVDGSLDLTFSGNGKAVTEFTPGVDGAYGVALQPADGKIVAAGIAGGANRKFALARYLAA